MDIHKPKPWSGWRDFLKEFATIVLGVSVALAAEQGVEWQHNRAKAAEARAGIREEIANNLGYINRRDATEACMSKRLDEVDGLIAASAAGKLPQDALWIGVPISSVGSDGKYKAAVQSGAVSLFNDSEQATYATIYGMLELYSGYYKDELNDWANLRTLESHPPASPTLDWQLRSALQLARIHRWSIQATRLVALRAAVRGGIALAPKQIVSTPAACVPLHTPREEALKRTFVPEWGLNSP